jgi:hypothetical protein
VSGATAVQRDQQNQRNGADSDPRHDYHPNQAHFPSFPPFTARQTFFLGNAFESGRSWEAAATRSTCRQPVMP